MGHTAALSASVTVALCGVLTLGPAAVASPEARTAPSTSAAASVSSVVSGTGNVAPEPKDKDREKLASTLRTVTKFGAASQKTGKVAGLAVNGEKDKAKLEKARKASDKELDNLMAIIPGGSPAATDGRAVTPSSALSSALSSAPSSARADLKGSVALIKADTQALVDAALKADVEAIMKAGGTLIVHMGQLATTIFVEIGLGAVKDVLPKLPALSQLPTVPAVPAAPTLPAVPAAPVLPGVPAAPSVPTVPAAPSVPGAPAAPSVPTVPGVPAVPGLPGAEATVGR
ncbi:hypothetical protein [Streptomyces sp. NPDC054863]